MHSSVGSLLSVGLATVLVLGLLAALGARLSVGSRFQGKCQCLFLACLGLVGVTTVIALAVTPGFWMISGASLSVMVLMATCDFRRSERAEAW